MALKFDPVINTGQVILGLGVLVGGIGTGFGIYMTFARAIDNHEMRMIRLEEVVVELRPFGSRLSTVEADVRRGREERLKFQADTERKYDEILKGISALREDVAALKASQHAYR